MKQKGFILAWTTIIAVGAAIVVLVGVYYSINRSNYTNKKNTATLASESPQIQSQYPSTMEQSCKIIDENDAVNIVKNLPEIQKYKNLIENKQGFISARKPTNVTNKNIYLQVDIGEKGDDWVSTKEIIYLDKCGKYLGKFQPPS